MKIKLVKGATTFEAAKNTIKQIDVNDFGYQNMIVVPDAFSMQAEELVFSCLDIKSAFNIQVVGISRLASMLLREGGVAFDRVSALEEVFYIYNAVKNCENNFVYFKNCDVEFCAKILQIIKQFKACRIKPNDIKKTGNNLLDEKMCDLQMVYVEYEKLLGDKLDLSKMLEKCAENETISKNLSKTRLFFANFDAFSLEIGEFLCKLAESVDAVFVGMAKPLSEGNAYIFENDILHKIQTIAGRYGVHVPTVNEPTNLSGDRLTMAKNLFSFDVKPGESQFFVNVLAKNMQEEVDYVARHIKNRIFHGAKLKDFAVALPDENYYKEVKSTFAKYGLVFYSDDATNLSQTILGRFLLKIIEISKLGFDKEKIKYLVSHPLLQKENFKQTLEEIDFNLIETADDFVKRFGDYQNITNLIKSLSGCKKLQDFTGVIAEIVNAVSQNYIKVVEEIETDKLYKVASENEQTLELVLQVLDKLVELGGQSEFALTDFEALFKFAMQSVKVETVPSYIDAIFVGDATKSYFQDVDTLYVLGANALPQSRNDVGIIDDEDIKKLRLNFVLEPEIKVLNRRARLKLFECLLHAKKSLIALNPPLDEKQTASYLLDLRKMFGGMVVNASSAQVFDDPKLSSNAKFERLLFAIGDKNNLVEKYSMLKAKNCLPVQYESMLSALAQEIRRDAKFENISKSAEKKIKKNSYSASSLENYFDCPFKFLMQNKLKIKEKETIEPDKRNFGLLEHELLQTFVSQGEISNFSKAQIDEFLSKNLISIAKKHYNEEILSKKHFINYLRKESRIILNNVVYESKFSAFKPTYFEEKVNASFADGTKFFGIVDRVDIQGDYFRILDYKTGAQDAVKKNLFYGKKLQLFLYAKVIKEQLNKICAGVYYFDCQTKYAQKGKKVVRLKGLTSKDEAVVNMSDAKFAMDAKQSDIINVRAKAKPKKDEFPFSSNYFVNNFDMLLDYAENVSKNAVHEIESGYIAPKPLSGECEFCKFNAICKHKKTDGFREMAPAREIFKDV